MSDFNITVPGGESKKLKTGGKYCPADIVVTAEGGGFTPPEDEVLTPELVYQTTRPGDWLKMPTPTDYECYCLGQILPGLSGHFFVIVTFTGTCTIEFGTVDNGAFVAKESYTPTSGTGFYATLAYNNYGDTLADGTRQYMARIYGTGITEINFRQHSSGSYRHVNIVDIVSGINCTFTAGDFNNFKSGLRSLQYLRFVGNGTPCFISANFVGGCPLLKCVYFENEIPNVRSLGYANYAFFECQSLMAVSGVAFSQIFDFTCAFYSTNIFSLRTSAKLTTLSNAFQYSRLAFFDAKSANTENVTNMDSAFYACTSLKSVTGLNISSLTGANSMFYYCFSLARLVFAGKTTPGGYTISLTDTALDHDALVEMIASLPTATAAATIAIAGVPGASELTDAEIAVATAKNWTITR